jgi:hypothetical protein
MGCNPSNICNRFVIKLCFIVLTKCNNKRGKHFSGGLKHLLATCWMLDHLKKHLGIANDMNLVITWLCNPQSRLKYDPRKLKEV